MSKLLDELKFWRCERPSEYKMDDFIHKVELLEEVLDEACNTLLNEGYYDLVTELYNKAGETQ